LHSNKGDYMKAFNINISKGAYAVILLSLLISACSGEKIASYTPTADSKTGGSTYVPESCTGIASSVLPLHNTNTTGNILNPIAATRSSGVAPLSVFFDGIATSAGHPFHDVEYRWNFGDSNAGVWTTGANRCVNSKNADTGPVAAHVFEKKGTYTVTETAFDGVSTSIKYHTIVVDDPDVVFAGSNTICIGATSAPVAGINGCPAGALSVMQPSFPVAVSTYALTGKRVLFQRGDTFAAATTARLNRDGPGIIGAFGTSSSAQPKVQMTGDAAILLLSSSGSPTIKDWRIMDLEFDGLSKTGSIGIDTDGGINQVLILNMNMHDIGNGILFNDSILTAWYLGSNLTSHRMFDEISITDSIITPIMNSTTGWRIFASALHGSIQGNSLGNFFNSKSMGSHVVRVPYMEDGIIAHNDIARAGASQLAIKMHSQGWCENTSAIGTCTVYDNVTPPSNYNYNNNTHPIGIFTTLTGVTQKVVVSDNKIIGADNPYTISLAPQNLQMDERVKDIIVERNWFTAGAATQLSVYVAASDTTIRNNIFDMSEASKYKTFVHVTPPGTAPPANNVSVYNNTMYGGSKPAISGNEFYGVHIDITATNVTVINNLISAPTATGSANPIAILGTGTGLIQSNNLLSAATASTFFTSAAPLVPADFSLKSAPNSARDTGLASVPIYSDFFFATRPQGAGMDIGAVEGP
jgi:hypothetical protein